MHTMLCLAWFSELRFFVFAATPRARSGRGAGACVGTGVCVSLWARPGAGPAPGRAGPGTHSNCPNE
eukprot:5477070-Prymnesium_polylepis.1